MIELFPANPIDGVLFESSRGILYRYDTTLNAWIRLYSNSSVIPIVTINKSGALSADDFKKLNRLVIPPPQSTIVGNNCFAPFTNGNLTLYSGDRFVNVEHSLKLFGEPEVISIPFHIHQHTFGFDFKLNVSQFIDELKSRNQLNLVGKKGLQGPKGDTGDPGSDKVLTGLRGLKGPPGLSPPCNIQVSQEVIQSIPQPGLKKAIVGAKLKVDPTDISKFSVTLQRQAVGPKVSTANKFNVAQQDSTWVLAIANVTGNPQPIYYIDIDAIIEPVHQKFLTEVEKLKTGYEDVVKFWVQTMSDLFDEQKAALCCALEFCISKTKSTQLRQHMESVAASAAGKAGITLHPRTSSESVEISSTSLFPDIGQSDLCDNGNVFPQDADVGPTVCCRAGSPHIVVFGFKSAGTGGCAELGNCPTFKFNLTWNTATSKYEAFNVPHPNCFGIVWNYFKATCIDNDYTLIEIQVANAPCDQSTQTFVITPTPGSCGAFSYQLATPCNCSGVSQQSVTRSASLSTFGGSGGAITNNTFGGLAVQSLPDQSSTHIITADPAINYGSVQNAAKVNLPQGKYVVTIKDTSAQIDKMHSISLKIVYSNNGNKKSARFLDKGKFDSLKDVKDAYEGLTLAFEHDGGEVSIYFPAMMSNNVSGVVVLEIARSSESIVKVPTIKSIVIPETLTETPEELCSMSGAHLAWYERGWKNRKCCGVVVNVANQDYIIVKRSIGDDPVCGGGENPNEPCIATFSDKYGHPAFAWPTFDNITFAPISKDIKFRYDKDLNDLVAKKINDGEYINSQGSADGSRFFGFQLSPILFPTQ